jgi:diadenylate cyclase
VTEFFTEVGRSLTSDWRPAVEIVLVAFMIYGVFRFLRGARGAAVLRGAFFGLMTLLALALFASQALGMARLQWVLEQLIALAAVGVLVVFQPEIRRALVRMGRSPFVTLFFKAESGTVDEVADAVAALLKQKAGALVAIEREDGLARYAKGGVKLDAEVSCELLVSLFAEGSPLRDGAAVLRAGKVVAAGCLLPLTENPDVAKSLGTRHRSGVGLTEETDAVTVIVSGDAGQVSVGVRGELMQGLSVEDLRGILAKLCAVSETEPAPVA